MNYETGLFFAFLTWIYGLISMTVNVNSQMNKNLKKVGVRLSWLQNSPLPLTKEDQEKSTWRNFLKFALIAVVGIPFIFLSWLQVALYVGTMIYKWNKDTGAPQAVKEFRWRMRNTNLSMDQVIQELMKVEGVEANQFDQYKANLIDEMQSRGLVVSQY